MRRRAGSSPLRLCALLAALAAASAQATAGANTSPVLAAIALSIRSRGDPPIQDSRCYLSNGGAVESFYISEDTPPGTGIGTLSVNGEPGPNGDITLAVQERDGGVSIKPGTKQVTLTRRLDREQRTGPASLYVNVRCDRRGTTDPSFIIPVSVRVWDVNDNAPEWSGAPYHVTLSEAVAPGSAVSAPLKATDRDQPGPHSTLRYSVQDGPYSQYFTFPNELQPVLVVAKPLDYESARNMTVTLRARDQAPQPRHSDVTLTVTLLDADDQNPKFTHDHYTVVVPNDATEGTVLEPSPGPISAYDQDLGIRAPVTYTVTGDTDLVGIDKDSGRLRAGAGVRGGQLPATIVIKATQVDNPDRYALATLHISRPPSPLTEAVSFTQRGYNAAVREDTAPGAVIVTLYTRPDRPKHAAPLQFYVSDRSFLDKFAIGSEGGVLLRRPLDYELQSHYSYQVMVTDGVANDTASLNISVLNVNEWEPRFKYPQYEFRVDASGVNDPGSSVGIGTPGDLEGSGLLPVGKLDVHDGDTPDTITLTLRGNDASLFYINGAGELFLRGESLSALNTSLLHVIVTATDSGEPSKQSSVPVLVHVSGALASRATRRDTVVAGLAAGGVLLALLVLVLVAALWRRRRAKASPSASPTSKSTFVSHDKPSPVAGGDGGAEHRAPEPRGALGAAPSGSLLSVSAGASTILANSTSSLDLRGDTLPSNGNRTSAGRQSTRYPKSKVAPQPPVSPQPAVSPTAMSDHLRGAGGRSGVAWPSHTIPARVKKLSWDDAAEPTDKGSSEQTTGNDHLNLTVYF